MSINTTAVAEAGNYIDLSGEYEVKVTNVLKVPMKSKPNEYQFEFTLTESGKGCTIIYRCSDTPLGYKFLKQLGNKCQLNVDEREWESWDALAQACVDSNVIIGIVVSEGKPYPDPVTGDMKLGIPYVSSVHKIG